MGFIQLVILEGVLLLCAGIIFFGGIRGTVVATVALSGINYLLHELNQFWRWEIPLLIGGVVGIALLFLIGKLTKESTVINKLVGGLISLVLFGAFLTPIVSIILWAIVIGTGIIPKNNERQVIKSLAPMVTRILLGVILIFFGNFLTI